MQLQYDTIHSISYGYYRCTKCHNTFYGGGPALHEKNCETSGYESCDYVIGPQVVQTIKEWASEYGDDTPTPLTGVSLNDVRKQLPEVL